MRNNAIGDLLCKVFVETMVNLTSEQKALLDEFEKSIGQQAKKHRPKEEGFFDGVKVF